MKTVVAALLLGVLVAPAGAFGATTGPGKTFATGTERLAAAVERLADLLEERKQRDQQDALARKLDTAIAYLNFRSRRIEMLEQDLQELRLAQDRFEAVLIQMQAKKELLEAQVQSAPLAAKEDLTKEREEHELRMKVLRERSERVERDGIALETKIQELQDEISSVESFVQRNLEF